MVIRVAYLALGLAVAAPAPAEPLTLHLICQGVGDHQVAHGNSATVFGRRGAVTGFGVSHSQVQFDEQMSVDLVDTVGTVRVPRRFLPPLHGGSEGSFELKDVAVTDDAITGTVLINFANHPKLRLDRRSGAVTLDGKVGSYSGECRKYDPAEQQRAF